MTEEEAKTKWCPLARVIVGRTGGVAGNRYLAGDWGDGRGGSNGAVERKSACIGSACMAWRWNQKRNPDWKPPHRMMSGYPIHPDDQSQPYVIDRENGRCGLAGSPTP